VAEDGFEQLIAEAEQAPFEGWDFAYLAGRMVDAPVPLDYAGAVRRRLANAEALLDLGTGGGEVLSAFAPFPRLTVATEAYQPNAYLAARRLGPLGASVALVEGAPENWETLGDPLRGMPRLPFRDASFDLVINRHESYLPAEVFRVLKPGGRFVTQQCGGAHYADLNDLIGAARPRYAGWSLAEARAQLSAAGFAVDAAEEVFTGTSIRDVGAIVYYLRAVPWQAPDFRLEASRPRLREIHDRIARRGPVTVRAHHFLVEAVKPA